ncbi:MAG: hypothetical protein ACFFG0_52200 [Candidatus Thorarchaeota archaeon]
MEKSKIGKYLTAGTGILIIGITWLLDWLGPAFFLFEEDSRWGHNFAIPILFITVGLAYNINKISCQLTAVIASYLTIPILLGFWRWDTGTIVAIIFLIIFLVFYLIERFKKSELINPNQRLKAWLKIHAMTFAYIGLVHMSLIFFFVRWLNYEAFTAYLPIEHHYSTSIFNAMLFVLTILAIMERFVKQMGSVSVKKAGFAWSILMIIIPLISIGVLGE